MKNMLIAAALVSIAAAASAQTESRPASASPMTGETIAVKESQTAGEVLKVNKAQKIATVKDAAGKQFKVRIPADVQGLDQIKPGAMLDLKYLPAVAFSIEKPGAAPHAMGEQSVRLAPRSGTPSEVAAKAKMMTATLLDFDRANQQITVKGPDGGEMTLQAPETFSGWDQLKTGESALIHYTEAVALTAAKSGGERAAETRDFERSSDRYVPDRTGSDTRRPGADPGYQERQEPAPPANQQPSQMPHHPR